MNSVIRVTLVAFAIAVLAFPVAAQQADHQSASNPLVQLLQSKGILTAEEAASVGTASNPGEANERLASLLLKKGLISQEEYNATAAASAVPVAGVQAAPGGARMVNAAATVTPISTTTANSKAPSPSTRPDTSRWPTSPMMVGYDPSDGASADAATIPAIAPVRVLPIGIPKDPKGIIPDIKLGSGAMINLYGFFKASAVYDTTNSGGSTFGSNDFPLPLLFNVGGDTGPNAGSQFRIKARAARFGANVFYPINGPDITLTGKVEFDWEGDYETANNRNVSSARSPLASLRLAWARMDAKIGGVPWFFLAGQDWTLLGSSTLPDYFETTGVGVFFGSFYERLPQLKTGLQFTAGDWKIEPEVAVVLGAFGDANLNNSAGVSLFGTSVVNNVPTGFQNQSREGALLGPASGEPGVQGRIVLDFPLNKDWKGVPNSEIIVSGGHSRGQEVLPLANIPSTTIAALTAAQGPCAASATGNSLRCYYPHGLTQSFPQNAFSVEAQIPTPWFTVVAKAYKGDALRFMFAGQATNAYADTLGLPTVAVPGTTLMCGPAASAGCAAGGTVTIPQNIWSLSGDTITFLNSAGAPVVAPLRPMRGYGGIAQLGIPLSRIFGANPEGLNSGWTFYMGYGVDGVVNRDVAQPNRYPLVAATANGLRLGVGASNLGLRRSDYVPISLRYKVNKWAQIVNEVTWYDTRLGTRQATATNPRGLFQVLFRGMDARINHDIREEFGTIFTF